MLKISNYPNLLNDKDVNAILLNMSFILGILTDFQKVMLPVINWEFESKHGMDCTQKSVASSGASSGASGSSSSIPLLPVPPPPSPLSPTPPPASPASPVSPPNQAGASNSLTGRQLAERNNILDALSGTHSTGGPTDQHT